MASSVFELVVAGWRWRVLGVFDLSASAFCHRFAAPIVVRDWAVVVTVTRQERGSVPSAGADERRDARARMYPRGVVVRRPACKPALNLREA